MDVVNKSYSIQANWFEEHYSGKEAQEKFLSAVYTHREAFKFNIKIPYDHIVDTLLDKNDSWFTFGDCYGTDGHYFTPYCKNIVSTDIADSLLKIAKELGYISDYSTENAEKLSFTDNSFDVGYCKEAYHHFPRPYLAVYEMLRCSKKFIIFDEPLDIILRMPLAMWFSNILDTKKKPLRSTKLWKNRFSFEGVGNFIYKVSQREFEKIALGIGLPAVAFYYYNNPIKGDDLKGFKKTLAIQNFLSKLGLLPYRRLTSVLFKELPDEKTKRNLLKKGYYYYETPNHPYDSN